MTYLDTVLLIGREKLQMANSVLIFSCCLLAMSFMQGCAGVSSFPTVARAGDTVSVMIGGSEKARKSTTSVILTDVDSTEWDLQSLGLVRSVFNLRADGRAEGSHYSSYLESYVSWSEGHEPVQTVLVVDLPAGAPAGDAFLTVGVPVDDDSSGYASPYTINIEIIPGTGGSDNFTRKGGAGVDFSSLEPAPHAKISFGSDVTVVGAVSVVVDFDEIVLNPDDINVYVPQSNVRGSFISDGSFGDKQRMVYWRQDGEKLFIDAIAPQGISQRYLMMYIMHPQGLPGLPAFNITSSKAYDVNGNEIVSLPILEYFP